MNIHSTFIEVLDSNILIVYVFDPIFFNQLCNYNINAKTKQKKNRCIAPD